MSRGNVQYAHTGETTEFEDILVKRGIVTREQVFAAKGLDARDFPEGDAHEVEQHESSPAHPLEHARLVELDRAQEDEDLDDDRMLARYRSKRLVELKQKQARERFGDIVEISQADWVAEVTEASKDCRVVVHLYQNRVEECQLLEEALQVVAKKFPAVKFLRIVATAAVPNWPDRNLPTLFLYHDGKLKSQLLGIKDLGGRSVQPKDIEWYLAQLGIVETELEEHPRKGTKTSYRASGGRTVDEDD